MVVRSLAAALACGREMIALVARQGGTGIGPCRCQRRAGSLILVAVGNKSHLAERCPDHYASRERG